MTWQHRRKSDGPRTDLVPSQAKPASANLKAKVITILQARKAFHGKSILGKLNNKVATSITDSVGTMWCAYAFAALALVSLPDALRSENPITIVAWTAQTFLQLVLLPIIIVGQNIQAKQSDLRAEVDHKNILTVYKLATENHDFSQETRGLLQDNRTGDRLAAIEEKLELLISRRA